MATKKSQAVQTTAVQVQPSPSPNSQEVSEKKQEVAPAGLDETLDYLIARQQEAHDSLRPCLVGPSGAGKTARVRAAAQRAGLPCVVLCGSGLLPEDIAIPRATNSHLEFLPLPQIRRACQEACVLFLDEFDKVPRDTKSVLLTLLWERRVHDLTLHPQSVIVAAMQPAADLDLWRTDETLIAIARRLLFLACPADWSWVATNLGLPQEVVSPFNALGVEAPLPVGDPSPRTICEFMRLAKPATPNVAKTLAIGVASQRWLDPLLALLEQSVLPGIDFHSVIRASADGGMSLAKSITIQDLLASGADPWLRECSAVAFCCALDRLDAACPQEVVFGWLERFFETLPQEKSNQMEIFRPDQDPEVVRAAINDFITKVNARRKEQEAVGKKAKKSA